jgi:hypothetical protein
MRSLALQAARSQSTRLRCSSLAIAHIGCLFSALVDRDQLSFLRRSPDSKISAPEFDRDPATRRIRQAGQCPIALA